MFVIVHEHKCFIVCAFLYCLLLEYVTCNYVGKVLLLLMYITTMEQSTLIQKVIHEHS